jgi:cobaltochelatase CobN
VAGEVYATGTASVSGEAYAGGPESLGAAGLGVSGGVYGAEQTFSAAAYEGRETVAAAYPQSLPTVGGVVYTSGDGTFAFGWPREKALLLEVVKETLPDHVYGALAPDTRLLLRVAPGASAAAAWGDLALEAKAELLPTGGLSVVGRLSWWGAPVGGAGIQVREVINMLLIAWPTEAGQLLVPMHRVHERHPEVEFAARTTVQAQTDLEELPALVDWADFVYISNVQEGALADLLVGMKDKLAGKVVAAYGVPYYCFPVIRLTNFAGTVFQDVYGNPLTDDQLYGLLNSVSQAKPPQTSWGVVRQLQSQYPAMARYLRAWEYRVAETASPENRTEMLVYFLEQAFPGRGYAAAPPVAAAVYGLYRDGRLFTDFAAFEKYLQPDRPAVGLVAWSALTWERGDLALLDRLIKELEASGLNALPLIAQGNPVYGAPTLAGMKAYFVDPAGKPRIRAVITILSFKLGGEQAAEAERFIAQYNIPVFRALQTPYEERTWEISETGLDWVSVATQVALPEVQGQIEPLVVAARHVSVDPLSGLLVEQNAPIAERVERLARRVAAWVRLQELANGDKKVALIYYSYPPGKQNLGASYLDVPASLWEILRLLEEAGYRVDGRPGSPEELLERLLEQGINVATWAPGMLEELAARATLWDAEEYLAWYRNLPEPARRELEEGPFGYIEAVVRRALETGERSEIFSALEKWRKSLVATIEEMKVSRAAEAQGTVEEACAALRQLLSGSGDWSAFLTAKGRFLELGVPGLCGWGPPPGKVMVVERGGRKYFVLPGVRYGNVLVAPQPQRGYEADVSMLYHSQVVPPHHQYLAFYAYLQRVFGADAMVHVGRHGTYEWLPRKEIALSAADYPDLCAGTVPSLYIYIMDGVGEVLHAKRRGLAVSISHLTPPLKGPELYGDLADLKTLVEQYQMAAPDQKPHVARVLRERCLALHLETVLGDPAALSDDALAEEVQHYLEDLQATWMPAGLHVFGRDWSVTQVVYLASSMARIPRLPAGQGRFVAPAEILGAAGLSVEECVYELYHGTSVQELVSRAASPGPQWQSALELVAADVRNVAASPAREREMLLKGLAGGYIPPAQGGDPLRNPAALPTGGNLYGLDPQKIPSPAAWARGRQLADEALRGYDVPEQLGVVIWATETQTDGGATVSFALRLMGVEPVWGFGLNVVGVRATDLASLGRPRVDVLMTTSGIFRETFPQVAVLLDRGVRVALAASYTMLCQAFEQEPPSVRAALYEALEGAVATIRKAGLFIPGEDPLEQNYVARHWLADTKLLLELGLSGTEAGRVAVSRLFGPALGTFGTRLPEAVRLAWTWEDRLELGRLYIDSMKYAYREDEWGREELEIFVSRLREVAGVYHSRSTSLYGVLDVDHNFEYLGGFGLAVEAAGGRMPGLFILNQVNPAQARVETLTTFLTRELQARYLNPEWVRGMMAHGYAGAHEMVHGFVANLWGWDVMRPDVVPDWMWQEVKAVFVDDRYGLGLRAWFDQGRNAYAFIELTGTMLTATHKGFWQADEAALRELANAWARAIIRHGPACCDSSCGNLKMMQWVTQFVDSRLLLQLNNVLQNTIRQPVLTPEQLAALTPRSSGSARPAAAAPPPEPKSETRPPEPEQPKPEEPRPPATQAPEHEAVPSQPAPPAGPPAPAAAQVPEAAPAVGPTPGPEPGAVAPAAPATPAPSPALPAPAEPAARAYEVEREPAAAGRGAVPLIAVLGVVALVALGAAGYFLARRKGV